MTIRVMIFKETGKLLNTALLQIIEGELDTFNTQKIVEIIRNVQPKIGDFVFEAYNKEKNQYNCRLIKKDEVV